MPESFERAPRLVDIGGRRLAVQIKGAGPAVLLEAGGGSGGIGPAWNGVDDRLAEFATVIVYDRAGTGFSEPQQAPPTCSDRARDLAGLLDAIPIAGPVILAGWSLGGLIAQHFAMLHPAKVAGLLLIDPTPPESFSTAPAWQRWLMRSSLPARFFSAVAGTGLLNTRRGRAWLQRMLEAQLGPKFDRSKLPILLDAVAQPRLHNVLRMETAALEQSCREVEATLRERGLPRVPLIVLTAGYRGKQAGSKALRRVAESHARTASSVPGGELRELADVSHSVPFEAPEAIVQGVRDLMARRA